MQFAAAASERCRIRATGNHVLARHFAEAAVGRRRHSRAKRGVSNHTSRLIGSVAERDVLERAAHIFALGHRQTGSQQQRGNDARLHRLAVNLALDELREHAGTLRVSDQHHAAALVVMFQVVIPGIEHVVVGQGTVHGHRRAAKEGPQRREGDLAVHGRIDPALRSKAGKLRAHHAFFFRTRDHIAVAGGIGRDCGIDVEAIDRRVRVGGPGFARQFAAGGDDGRGHVNGTGVLPAGTAEPVVPVAVIVLRGHGGLGWGFSLCWRRGGGLGEAQARASAGAHQSQCSNKASYHNFPLFRVPENLEEVEDHLTKLA